VAGATLMSLSLAVVGAGSGGATSPSRAPWTVYHGDPEGHGDVAGPSFASATPAWTSPMLDGQLYGEPLELGGRVFVATEDDSVYALAADSGKVLWHRHLGTPVPATALPCGDITPTVGITSTPVVDRTRDEIFVVADEEVSGAPAHELVGLDARDGAVRLTRDVDPPGADTAALLQRDGLALDQGRVLIGFGGNFGDCSTYHGWVESVPVVGSGSVDRYQVDSGAGQTQGAVWMGGAAPEVEPSGAVWFAAGNGSVTSSQGPYDGSESVNELSPSLSLEQQFAPSNWYSDNAEDRDIGSSAPALLSDGLVVQAGKSHSAYLLNASSLGGVGGQQAELAVCSGGDVDGGDAVSGTVVFLPCQQGLEAFQVNTSPPSLTVLWQTSTGASAPPIVAGGLVWSMGGANLYGLDPQTGDATVTLAVGQPANHFPTPSVGDGLLLADGADQVHAFAGSAGLPGPPQTKSPKSRRGASG
jgi:outer membrane protein assembly factor BamB